MFARNDSHRGPGSTRAGILAIACLLLAPALARGQAVELTDTSAFSGSETLIDFEGFADGTPLTTQYAAQGVSFILTDGTAPRVTSVDSTPRVSGPTGTGAIDNISGAPPFADLRATFSQPVNRVAFEIRNNDADDLELTLVCVSSGSVMGAHTFSTGLGFTLVGLDSPSAFDEILIDVSDGASGAFRLDNLRFECEGGLAAPGLTQPTQFSGSETVIDFEGFADGTPITDQYATIGVELVLSQGSAPVVSNAHTAPRQFGPAGPGAIENFPPGTAPPFPDLFVRFTHPMNRVAFEIRHGDPDDLVLSLVCLQSGCVVGTGLFDTGFDFEFAGLQSDVPFDEVRIDVTGAATGAFVLDNLRFESDADATAPVVTILSPADGAIVGTENVVVTAEVADETATTVVSTPAGVDATLAAPGGTTSGSVALSEGRNSISVSATDAGGNTGGTSITVLRDTTRPWLAALAPAQGTVVGSSPVAISLATTDATDVTVTIDGQVSSVASPGGWANADVALAEGPNAIVISLVDQAGNANVIVLELVLDSTSPLVSIDSPADGSCYGPGSETIPVVATIDDLGATEVTSIPGGVAGSLPPGGGLIGGSVVLAEGSNSITVGATDALGHSSSSTIVVVLDTTPPMVSVDSPSDGVAVSGSIDFDAAVADVAPGTGIASVVLAVDGAPVATLTAPPYGTIHDTTGLVDGWHTFEATATDGKGNEESASVSVLVDNTPPVVVIASPADGALVTGQIDLDVQASDTTAGLVVVELRAGVDAPTDDPSRVFGTPVPSYAELGLEDTTQRPDGPLTLTAHAVDDAGNESSVSVQVTVDNTAPSRSLVSPTDGQTVSGMISIVTASDDADLDYLEIEIDGVLMGESYNSPYVLEYDTLGRMDGAMVVTAYTEDHAGNVTVCTATVMVDNSSFELTPNVLNLRQKKDENGSTVKARLSGPNLGLMMPTEAHGLALRVPGGNPVPADTDWSGDDKLSKNGQELELRFDRSELVNSIAAGIAAGQIQPGAAVRVQLVAENDAVIGEVLVRTVH